LIGSQHLFKTKLSGLMRSGARIRTIRVYSLNESAQRQPIYSVRIGIGYHALGLWEKDHIYWFWIGSHAEYDQLLKRL
jgi:hypothetical protein